MARSILAILDGGSWLEWKDRLPIVLHTHHSGRVVFAHHQSLRITPAMEAGLSDHVWSLDEVIALLDRRVCQFVPSAEPRINDPFYGSPLSESDLSMGLRATEIEYMPGDIVLVSSPLYRVVHDPPGEGKQLKTFNVGDRFPYCSECGKKARYMRQWTSHPADKIYSVEVASSLNRDTALVL